MNELQLKDFDTADIIGNENVYENGSIYGFCYALDSDDNIIQCCCEQKADGTIQIDADNDGMDTGICSDSNEPAVKKHGFDECRKALYKIANENDVEIIND